jgi:hypothetical protein
MKRIIILVFIVVAVGWWLQTRFGAPPAQNAATPPVTAIAPPVVLPPPTPPMPAASIPVVKSSVPSRPAAMTVAAVPGRITPAAVPEIPMPIAQMLQPGNKFEDVLLGVSATFPEGWSVRQAIRWGDNNRQITVFLAPAEGQAIPSMYYQDYPNGAPPPGESEAMLREMAQKKEESRSANGANDYKNDPDSFVFREINGRPTLSYFATYTRGNDVQAEYFMRILGQKSYVMFFVRGPAKDVQAVIPQVYQMGGTVKVP